MTKKEKEYVLNLSEDANAFIRFNTKEGIVDEFVVKLLFFPEMSGMKFSVTTVDTTALIKIYKRQCCQKSMV